MKCTWVYLTQRRWICKLAGCRLSARCITADLIQTTVIHIETYLHFKLLLRALQILSLLTFVLNFIFSFLLSFSSARFRFSHARTNERRLNLQPFVQLLISFHFLEGRSRGCSRGIKLESLDIDITTTSSSIILQGYLDDSKKNCLIISRDYLNN